MPAPGDPARLGVHWLQPTEVIDMAQGPCFTFRTLVAVASAAVAFSSTAVGQCTQVEDQFLVATDGEPGDGFGRQLALDGDTLLVGASGFVGKLINGDIDVLLIALLGVTGMVGSYLGALRTGRMNTNNLRVAIGVVLIAVAPFMGVRALLEFPD